MTDFETTLRARLLRLEAARPEPAPLWSRTGRSRVGRRSIVVLAAAITLVGASIAVAATSSDKQAAAEIAADERAKVEIPRQVTAAIKPFFPALECVPPAEAARRVREALDAAGFQTWQIMRDVESLEAEGCAAFRIDDVTRFPEAVTLFGVPKAR